MQDIEQLYEVAHDGDIQSHSGDRIEYLEDPDMMSSAASMLSKAALAARGRFCRVCLKKSESFLLPLVAKMERVSVMEMLVDVTGIELEVNSLYPTKVCTNCMTKLDFAYNVRQEFLSSAELLLKMAVEGRLPAYYAQFADGNEEYGTYTDEILKASKSILEGKTAMSAYQTELETESIEMVEEDEESDHDSEDVEGIKVEKEPVQETSIDVEILEHEETLLTVQTNDSEAPESQQEKFVYSWKDLVKPKRTKKERPKTALTGINRKAKADSELLTQFPQTTCYICDTSHETLEQRDEHLNVHISMVPHRCETCSTETEPVISKSVLTLNRHRLMHRLPYKCDFCFRRFISSGSQYTHVWSMHMGETEGLTCDFCGKGFTQKRSFQGHVRRHRYKANGKYKCDICEESCGSSLLLARHQRKHTGEKNFACPYCEKTFSRACNLLTHKRIHTNERCHKCLECGSAFRDSVTLRKHQERLHLGKIPALKIDRNPYIITEDGRKEFKCKYEGCSYTTHSSTSISRHKARHSKRYACGECGKRFAEPNLVRRHQASMHSGGKGRKKASAATAEIQQQKTTLEQEEIDAIEEEVYLEEEYEELKTEPEYEVEVVDEIEAAKS